MNGSISNDILQVRWPLGVPPPSQPETRYDVLTWSLMNETHQIMPNSEENVRLLSKIDQEDIKVRSSMFFSCKYSNSYQFKTNFLQRVLARTLIEAKKKYPNLTYQRLHSLYRKFDPVRGMDYNLHLVFTDSHSQRSIVKRFVPPPQNTDFRCP